jgi:1-deoxy-D-xylulose-5-phosphate reductoisomerase
MNAPKNIAVLGSTGSIGTQALAIMRLYPERFRPAVLTAGRQWQTLAAQAREFHPAVVVIGDEQLRPQLAEALADLPISVMAGEQALEDCVRLDSLDLVLTALVGFAGLRPTLAALEAGKPIALANKETMVVAGELVTQLAGAQAVPIYPVDSEHSAVFQCLQGERRADLNKIYLTASGGPFRGYDRASLQGVRKEQALKHPNWDMGAKITIDSATMMNKGLEVIEAKWFFDLPLSQIDIVVHPQSIIHSMVEFADGSLKAEMGLPDMRQPIAYALAYPERLDCQLPRVDFAQLRELTFEPVDQEVFRSVACAYQALEQRGNMPCILNAANEIAVEAFLQDRIRFLDIFACVEQAMQQVPYQAAPALNDLIETDQMTRAKVNELTHGKFA